VSGGLRLEHAGNTANPQVAGASCGNWKSGCLLMVSEGGNGFEIQTAVSMKSGWKQSKPSFHSPLSANTE